MNDQHQHQQQRQCKSQQPPHPAKRLHIETKYLKFRSYKPKCVESTVPNCGSKRTWIIGSDKRAPQSTAPKQAKIALVSVDAEHRRRRRDKIRLLEHDPSKKIVKSLAKHLEDDAKKQPKNDALQRQSAAASNSKKYKTFDIASFPRVFSTSDLMEKMTEGDDDKPRSGNVECIYEPRTLTNKTTTMIFGNGETTPTEFISKEGAAETEAEEDSGKERSLLELKNENENLHRTNKERETLLDELRHSVRLLESRLEQTEALQEERKRRSSSCDDGVRQANAELAQDNARLRMLVDQQQRSLQLAQRRLNTFEAETKRLKQRNVDLERETDALRVRNERLLKVVALREVLTMGDNLSQQPSNEKVTTATTSTAAAKRNPLRDIRNFNALHEMNKVYRF